MRQKAAAAADIGWGCLLSDIRPDDPQWKKKWGGHMSKLGLLLPLVFLEPVDLLVGTGHTRFRGTPRGFSGECNFQSQLG